MHLSHKQQTFSESICVFLKFRLNFKHFPKKMTLVADVFPKLRTLKHVIRYLSRMSRFKGPFEIPHAKWAETRLQSERQHLYHIY